MTKTTELEIRFPGKGRFTHAEVMPNGIVRLTVVLEEEVESKTNEDVFVLVEASKLSLEDRFMKHKPTTEAEKKLKSLIKEAIHKGIKDFYRPKYGPSFTDESKTEIQFVAGKKPAVGRSHNWWNKTLKEYCPERNSRQGTKLEYVAFLGVLIKSLVDKGWKIKAAWNAVCNDSKELGHYRNSENAKHDFEDTGSREVCGFYDLANTYKLLAEDEEAGGFWLVGGCYNNVSDGCPLDDLEYNIARDFNFNYSVGWLVLSK